jgi:hypothetical protein
MRALRGGATCRQEARDGAIHVLAFPRMLHARSVGFNLKRSATISAFEDDAPMVWNSCPILL